MNNEYLIPVLSKNLIKNQWCLLWIHFHVNHYFVLQRPSLETIVTWIEWDTLALLFGMVCSLLKFYFNVVMRFCFVKDLVAVLIRAWLCLLLFCSCSVILFINVYTVELSLTATFLQQTHFWSQRTVLACTLILTSLPRPPLYNSNGH